MFGTLLLILLNDEAAPLESGQLGIGVGNDGAADILVGTATITGDGAAAFSIVDDPVSNTTLVPGAQRRIVVEADTTVPGEYAAFLRIPSSDDDGAIEVPLFLTVIAPEALVPGIAVDPTGTVSFGSVDITSGSTPITFTVTSTGTADLVCGTVGLTGTGYAKSADGISGATIPPGESRTVVVTFDPASIGTKPGTLTIPSDDPDGSVVITLTGVGTTGAPAPEPTSVTRFYLTRQASPVAAITSGGSWAVETTDPDRLLATAKGGPVVSNGEAVEWHYSSSAYARLGRWVSPPLEAQTVDTPILCYCVGHRSSALGSNVSSALRFGIRHSDGSLGWFGLLALTGVASPWGSSAAPGPRRFPAGTPLSWRLMTTFADGDRLVVELGARVFTGAVGSLRIRYGGASTDADLDSTESPATIDLTKAPWIEFATGLLVSP